MKDLTFERVPSKRYRELVDFVVSGKSILAELDRRGYELVPRVGSGLVSIDQETRSHLLLERDDELSSRRVALYTCPCGDYGCGVVSVLIEKRGRHITWSEFRFENGHDDEIIPLEKLGPFTFAAEKYHNTVMNANSTS